MQIRIPPELRSPTKTVVPITGLDKTPEMENHDPSNIILHNGMYYLWYTEHHQDTDGFINCFIKYATSPNGLHWQVRGIALEKGEPHNPDAQGVLTTYIVPSGGKYFMFFLAVGPEFQDPEISQRGIWLAEADSPDGPWIKHLDTPILWPGDVGTWDELCCDDPNVIYRSGKWWLYYKGRKVGSHPMDSFTGLAQAELITGPYVKYRENPLMTGHAGSAWVHRNGVAAIGGEVDNPVNQCIRWSEDGIHFVEAGVFPNKSTGVFCPEDYGNGINSRGVTWGMDVVAGIRPRYLYRFGCDLSIKD